MAETALNKRVMEALRKEGLHPVRVENPACPGTPDINYTGGWIENKQLPAWPVSAETIVRVDHFSPQQRVWHTQRARAGGVSYVMLQVGRDYVLLRGLDAAINLGRVGATELLAMSLGFWRGQLNDSEFIAALVTE